MSPYLILSLINILAIHTSLEKETKNNNIRELNLIPTEYINPEQIFFPTIQITKNKYYPIEIGHPNNDILSSLSFTHNGALVKNIIIFDEVNDEHVSNSRNERDDICLNDSVCEKKKLDNTIILCKLTKVPMSYHSVTISRSIFEVNDIFPLNNSILLNNAGTIMYIKPKPQVKIESARHTNFGESSDRYLLSKNYTGIAWLYSIKSFKIQELSIDESKGDNLLSPWFSFDSSSNIVNNIRKIMRYKNDYFLVLTENDLYYKVITDDSFHILEYNVQDFIVNEQSILIAKNEGTLTNLKLIRYPDNESEMQSYNMTGSFLLMDYIYPQNNHTNEAMPNYYYVVICTQTESIGHYELFYFTYNNNYMNKFISIKKGNIYFSDEKNNYNFLINSYKGILYYFIGNDKSYLKQIDIYHLNEFGEHRFEYTSLYLEDNLKDTILMNGQNYIIPVGSDEKGILIPNNQKSYVIDYISEHVQELKCKFKEEGIYEQLYTTSNDCSNGSSVQKCLYNKKVLLIVKEIADSGFSNRYKIISYLILGLTLLIIVFLVIGIIILSVKEKKEEKQNNQYEPEEEKLKNENKNDENKDERAENL